MYDCLCLSYFWRGVCEIYTTSHARLPLFVVILIRGLWDLHHITVPLTLSVVFLIKSSWDVPFITCTVASVFLIFLVQRGVLCMRYNLICTIASVCCILDKGFVRFTQHHMYRCLCFLSLLLKGGFCVWDLQFDFYNCLFTGLWLIGWNFQQSNHRPLISMIHSFCASLPLFIWIGHSVTHPHTHPHTHIISMIHSSYSTLHMHK